MGGLFGGILVVFVLAVTIVAVIRRRREKAPIQDYDYIGPPQLPARPQGITTSSNVAYISTIPTQANTAYASTLEMQP